MEVFLANVPFHLTSRGLQLELGPILQTIGIHDWMVEKTVRRNVALLRFLEEADGLVFLATHKDTSTGPYRFKSLISIQGSAVVAYKSRDNPPNEFIMRALRRSREQREIKVNASQPRRLTMAAAAKERERRETINFTLTHVGAGYNWFRKSPKQLVFVEEWSTNQCGPDAVARFGRDKLVLSFRARDRPGAVNMRIEIGYGTVASGMTDMDKSIRFALSEPPVMYAIRDEDQADAEDGDLDDAAAAAALARPKVNTLTPNRRRLAALPGMPLSVTSHLLYISIEFCTHRRFSRRAVISRPVERLISLARFPVTAKYVPRVKPSSVRSLGLPLDAYLVQCRRQTEIFASWASVPFDAGFQLAAIVANGYLHPRIALTVLFMIKKMWRRARKRGELAPITAEAIRRAALKIPYASAETMPRQLTPKAIVALMKNESTRIRVEERRDIHKDYRDPERERDEKQEQINRLRAELQGTGQNSAGKVLVYKAIVTPTRLVLTGPDLEAPNRLLRTHGVANQFFMRVQFSDESGDDIYFSPGVSFRDVLARFEAVLANGIEVAGRVYRFLGFSHSSLRARSVWCAAPFYGPTRNLVAYSDIISGFGDFAGIRVPAKCAARIGQAFSETPFFINLDEVGISVVTIPDVKSADGERVFSDGVGSISPPALQVIWRNLPRYKKRTIRNQPSSRPTCLQIRLGSVKGMLALDSSLRGTHVCIRVESMAKFPCSDVTNLGICDVSDKPMRLYLNRQMIKILEDVGVPPAWFLREQRKELDLLKAATASAEKTRNFLNRNAIGQSFRFPRLITELDRQGLSFKQDQFLRSIVENVVLREVRLLKHKSRIPIAKGATLFGVMDESGYLAEDEIYVSFDRTSTIARDFMDTTLWGGHRRRPALITRSPALHPGDVQLVTMVLPPSDHPLRKLENCIAFSRHGDRDLPSKLSGGDLDGDMYHVIWDPDAMSIPADGGDGELQLTMSEPADYPRVSAKALDRPVEPIDMIRHFLNFMESDQLGVIATRHMILADQRPSGSKDPDCITLAEIHSTAVDFSKTGIPINSQQLLGVRINRIRPDFLAPAPLAVLQAAGQVAFLSEEGGYMDDYEDDGSPPVIHYYKSDRILGQLYRNVDERKIWSESVNMGSSSSTGPGSNTPAMVENVKKLHKHKLRRKRRRDEKEEEKRAQNQKTKPNRKQKPKQRTPEPGFSIWERLVDSIHDEVECYAPGRINWLRRAAEAWQLRYIFEEEVVRLSRRFSSSHRTPLREVEVFCGTIFNRTGSQTRRQRDNSLQLHEEITRNTDWLTRRIRNVAIIAGTAAARSQLAASEGQDGTPSADGDDSEPDGDLDGLDNGGGGGDTDKHVDNPSAPEETTLLDRTIDAIEMALACIVICSLPEEHWDPVYYLDGKLNSFRVVAASCLVRDVATLKGEWERLKAKEAKMAKKRSILPMRGMGGQGGEGPGWWWSEPEREHEAIIIPDDEDDDEEEEVESDEESDEGEDEDDEEGESGKDVGMDSREIIEID